ncbi:TetR/AcrR family transcriptional regulator [Nocardia crassostreae]|uniref:TetR/AcrR family transcriptional regulator n=1 Tax=Nocardia crassostreae TaxID=53428 RepID=UPI0008352ECD|nr:helix-turn-helix domain-containing protein [Nocardia crassostreae]
METSQRANRGPKAAAGNRAALIRAARELFAADGFDVPLSAIARAAGVGQGVLYRHFPTRESIALTVFEENIAEVEAAAANPESTVDDILAVIVGQLTDSAAFIAVLDPADTEDPRLCEVGRRLFDLTERKLADPDRRGALRPDIVTGDVMMAVAMLGGILSKTPVATRADAARQAWSLLRRGLHG